MKLTSTSSRSINNEKNTDTAVAAVVNGFCRFGSDISVRLRGGVLVVRVGENLGVTLTGDCVRVFDGEYEFGNG